MKIIEKFKFDDEKDMFFDAIGITDKEIKYISKTLDEITNKMTGKTMKRSKLFKLFIELCEEMNRQDLLLILFFAFEDHYIFFCKEKKK